MRKRGLKLALSGTLAGAGLVLLTSTSLFAQGPTPEPSPEASPGHQLMHQMMDAVHGDGASQRMHEAMGADAEKLMDQCVSMMGMMQNMQGMMDGNMSGMMGDGGMSGMMGGQNGQSMQEMMRNMMTPAQGQ